MTRNGAAVAAGLVIALGWGATACGGGSPGAGVATLSGATGSASHATTTLAPNPRNATLLLHEWANCMRQHGIQMADPTVNTQGQIGVSVTGSGNLSTQTFQGADAACSSLHNQAIAALGGNRGLGKPDPTKLLAFSKCMRAHGLPDFPDPGANGALQLQGGPTSDLNPNNPAFQAAQRSCQHFLGPLQGGMRVQVGGGGSATGTGGASAGAKP